MSALAKKMKWLKKDFKQSLESLNKSIKNLDYSYNKCLKIGIKEEYLEDELEIFESLTSRFARAADIFTQKILTALFILLKENPVSFIDKSNLAEKLGIINSAKDLQDIRELRNEIAHEYSMREITDIFEDVLKCTGNLKEIWTEAQNYIRDKIPLDE
ncbi:MAG TPA: hypothetical protein VK186_20980 [Candidatus Deferrimicrobium sp.]|nr:hypothetical protein [Candidatus Deferrimicrobium sp.]